MTRLSVPGPAALPRAEDRRRALPQRLVGVGHQAGQHSRVEGGERSLRLQRGVRTTLSGRPIDRNEAWMLVSQPPFRSRTQGLEEWLADRIEHSAASPSTGPVVIAWACHDRGSS